MTALSEELLLRLIDNTNDRLADYEDFAAKVTLVLEHQRFQHLTAEEKLAALTTLLEEHRAAQRPLERVKDILVGFIKAT